MLSVWVCRWLPVVVLFDLVMFGMLLSIDATDVLMLLYIVIDGWSSFVVLWST